MDVIIVKNVTTNKLDIVDAIDLTTVYHSGFSNISEILIQLGHALELGQAYLHPTLLRQCRPAKYKH